MAATLIPLTSAYADTVMTVQIDGRSYRIRMTWNTRLESWFLSLGTQDEWLVAGVRAVSGHTTFARRRHNSMPGGLFVLLDTDGGGDPGIDDLGTRVILVYLADFESTTTTESLEIVAT